MTRIFLLGYMGAGKTTLGKAFAQKYNLSFIDLDWYIEERFHKTINELFEEKGETEFREIERKMLHEVAAFENVIISTGGGTPCFFDNMEFMNKCGETVFLNVHPDILFGRLKMGIQSRPKLHGLKDEELKSFIICGLDNRNDSYQKAKFILNADNLDKQYQIDYLVTRLCQLLGISE